MRKYCVVLALLIFGGVALAGGSGSHRRVYSPDVTERLALRDVVRRYEEVQKDLSAVISKARKDRTDIQPDEKFGYDLQTGEFYVEVAEVVSSTPTDLIVPVGSIASVGSPQK